MNPILIDLIKIACVIGVLMGLVAYAVLAERRISAFIQDRIGPNRNGIPLWIRKDASAVTILDRWALGQPMIDGLKFFFKEDYVPGHVNKFFFWLAPMLVMIPALLTFAAIPFGSTLGGVPMVIADLNVGILFIFSIASLGIYGIVLAGWASNSKYPFLGGIRSSAQLISYEICLGLSVVPLFMQVGDLRLGALVEWQNRNGWLVFYPWNWLPFIIFLVSVFAETNRLPFDLPEAETELVSGYHTEYSSLKFGMFFMAEYANMITASALVTTLFLGGWNLPFVPVGDSFLLGLVHIGIFLAKVFGLIFFFMWIRWTLPRFRYDQLMSLGWKRFLPLALASIIVVGFVILAGWSRS